MKLLLLILKILGFGILGILGILLIVLAYVVFVPIRYELDGAFLEENSINVYVHDFLRIVRFSLNWNTKNTQTQCSVLCFRLMNDESEEDVEVPAKTEDSVELAEEEDILVPKEPHSEASHQAKQNAPKVSSKHHRQKAKEQPEEASEISTYAKVQRLLDDDIAMEGVRGILARVVKILRRVAPRVYSYDLEFYTGEPDTTGELVGIIASVPWVYRDKKHRILPDFTQEEPYIHGTIHLKGRVALLQFIGLAGYFFFNKNASRLRAHLKRF